MGTQLTHIDEDVSLSELENEEIEIRNITATFSIEGEFDRSALADDLPNSEFNPEKHRSLIYRSPITDSLVVLLPPSGKASLVGITTPGEIVEGVEEFIEQLSEIGVGREYSDIRVENLVSTIDLGTPLNLSEVVVKLGFESTEYEPEQFPGVIYRAENDTVALIYSSGKAVITKADTYAQILECYIHIKNELG